jgi:hypothetical protein
VFVTVCQCVLTLNFVGPCRESLPISSTTAQLPFFLPPSYTYMDKQVTTHSLDDVITSFLPGGCDYYILQLLHSFAEYSFALSIDSSSFPPIESLTLHSGFKIDNVLNCIKDYNYPHSLDIELLTFILAPSFLFCGAIVTKKVRAFLPVNLSPIGMKINKQALHGDLTEPQISTVPTNLSSGLN